MPARQHMALLLLAALGAASGRHILQYNPEPPPSHVASLLAQRDAITNWAAFSAASGLAGWEDAALLGAGTPVCSWGGVRCNGEGNITTIDLSCKQDQLELCAVKAQGTLAPSLSLIQFLNTISIGNQSLTGSLPAEWGTSPGLAFIYLQDNNLTGTLPSSWGEAGAMPELASMDLSNNKLSGTLPDAWGRPGALPKLIILAMPLNQLSGPLPPSWATNGTLPSLSRLGLGGNAFTGSLPPEWGTQGAFSELEYLALCCQNITGPLPELWADGFKNLDQLYMDALELTGTLPASWGASNVFPMLSGLYLSNNSLSGSVPATWSAPAAFPRLIKLEIQNTGVCGPVSGKIDRAVCGVADQSCVDGSIPCGPPSPSPATLAPPSLSPDPPPSQPAPLVDTPSLPPSGVAQPPSPPPPANTTTVEGASSSSSSSVPIGAIVGGAIGGLAILALLAFLACRPRKGWLRSQESGKQQAPARAASFGPGSPKDPQLPVGAWQAGAGGKELDSFITTSTTSGAAVLGTPKGTEDTRGGLLGSSAPPTSSLHSLESDALLSFITSRLASSQHHTHSQTQSGARSAAAPGSLARLPADISQWEVQWGDINLHTLIGGGSFGRVYAGVWKETPVACKVLIQQGFQNEGSDSLLLPQDTLKQLHEEAGVMAAMRHPNLVTFMGICMVPPCILTELCSKGNLYEVLHQARQRADKAAELTWRRRLEMALDGATGLLYLHTHNPPIIHNDVKSPNLLVDQAWRVKVSDFNLSRLMQQGQESSIMSTRGGVTNPIWLAPEILRGQRATAAADVFSFAMVMLELLTWQLPWEGRQPFTIAHLVLDGHRPELPPPGDLPGQNMASCAGLQAYCQLMSECWAQDPLQRPAFSQIVPRLRTLLHAA